jgi:hypothetical protein
MPLEIRSCARVCSDAMHAYSACSRRYIVFQAVVVLPVVVPWLLLFCQPELDESGTLAGYMEPEKTRDTGWLLIKLSRLGSFGAAGCSVTGGARISEHTHHNCDGSKLRQQCLRRRVDAQRG